MFLRFCLVKGARQKVEMLTACHMNENVKLERKISSLMQKSEKKTKKIDNLLTAYTVEQIDIQKFI